MIGKLEEYRIGDQNTCHGYRAPSNWELMKKINELVDEVNRLKRKLSAHQFKEMKRKENGECLSPRSKV